MDDKFENLPDWQQRFVIEYEELANRVKKLQAVLDEHDEGPLDFSRRRLGMLRAQLRAQLSIMCAYKAILEERAEFEDIDLSILADPKE